MRESDRRPVDDVLMQHKVGFFLATAQLGRWGKLNTEACLSNSRANRLSIALCSPAAQPA